MGEQVKRKFLRTFMLVEKETLNTVRFQEVRAVDGEQVTDYIYIRKTALAEIGNPEMIQVEISPAKGTDQ